MFGAQLPLSIGGQMPLQSVPQVLPPDMPQVSLPKKAGMFGQGGVGRAIAGMIGDFLLQRAGMQPVYQPTMMEKWKHAQESADYDRRRSDQNADWQSHYDYEAQNPKPTQPGEFEQRLVASGVQPGTPQWTDAMKAAVQNVTDPIVMTPQGAMLRSQVMGALQQPEILQTLPPGAKPIGGPTPPASGGFPGY